jgi:DNA-binding LacI/PurR family transcriptional regulator
MAEDCSQDRRAGYCAALQAAGISYNDAWVAEGDWSAQSGYDNLMRLAQNGRLPSAFFVQNDQMAVGALSAARELGLDLPEQLSIISIDNLPLAPYFTPPLTTLDQDFSALGHEAVGLLIQAIKTPDQPHQHLLLPAKLITRRSTCAPAQ